MDETIKELSKKLSDDAIQRTDGTKTKKGYSTTGYGYQASVDKFNEVLGEDWNFSWEIIHEEKGNYKSGMPYISITVKVSIGIKDKQVRSCVGGHTSNNYADALKGAITNGFKKTAAFWGVGRDAFAGTIDDDNQPLPDSDDNKADPEDKPDPKKVYENFYNSLSDDYKFELKDMSKSERYDLFVKCEWNVKKLDEEIVKWSKENAVKVAVNKVQNGELSI